MNNFDITKDLRSLLSQIQKDVFEFLPTLILVFVILLFGLLFARIIKVVTVKLLGSLNKLLEQKKVSKFFHPELFANAISIVSNLIYWTIILLFFTIATETIGLPVITTWFSGLINILPKILIAVLIGSLGIVSGYMLKDIVISFASSARIIHAELTGKLVQYCIIMISILVAIDHIGIDISFLTNVILIVLGSLFFGLALAFGLGARDFVCCMFTVRYLQKLFKVGDFIKLNDVEGRIKQFLQTAVIIETLDGQIFVPAGQFNKTYTVLPKLDK